MAEHMQEEYLYLPPEHLLVCPRCQADVDHGLDIDQQHCNNCDLYLFDLAGVPCWFAYGIEQKMIWAHHLAVAQQLAQQNQQIMQSKIDSAYLMQSTHQRIKQVALAGQASFASIESMLTQAGLTPKLSQMLSPQDAGVINKYFSLLHRDWGWHHQKQSEYQDESQAQFKLLAKIVERTFKLQPIGDTLVVGGGAGRLSFDFHKQFTPSSTTVLDFNPVLVQAGFQILHQQQSIELAETHQFPVLGLQPSYQRQLSYAATEAELEHFHFINADVFSAPIKESSIDLLITPWFIDVVAVDLTKTLAMIQRLLKPGGIWINLGPLLHHEHIAFESKYYETEIRELMQLADFTLLHEDIEQIAYLQSPDDQRLRKEQNWCFSAKNTQLSAQELATKTYQTAEGKQWPRWLLLTHLPIILDIEIQVDKHPVLQFLAQQIDGKKSINDLAAMLEGKLPEGMDGLETIKMVFSQYILS